MPLFTVLRITPAAWIAPVLVVLAVITSTDHLATSDPYPSALVTAGASTVFMLGPACAALAAWEGGRLRRAGWLDLPHVRTTASLVGWSLAPILVAGLASVALAVIRLLGRVEAATPDARILGVAVAVIVAHALVGFAVGTLAPPVIAVPSVLLVGYGWMVLPLAQEPLWIRHLTGWYVCCDVSAEIAPQALAASVVVAVGFGLTAVVLLARSLGGRRFALAAIPIAAGLASGAVLAQGLGADPVIPRAEMSLVCLPGPPRVCVWPEHRTRLGEVSAIASRAVAGWQRVGISVPSEFSEPGTLSVNERRFGFSLESPRHSVLESLSYSMLPPWPSCAERGPYPAAAAEEPVLAWLAATAGMPRADLTNRFSEEAVSVVSEIRALPPGSQRMWFEVNTEAMRSCDTQPRLDVGR